MLEISVKEARKSLSALLDAIEQGERAIITRRGKKVAELRPVPSRPAKLPSLKAWRDSIQVEGEPLSQTVISLRNEERL